MAYVDQFGRPVDQYGRLLPQQQNYQQPNQAPQYGSTLSQQPGYQQPIYPGRQPVQPMQQNYQQPMYPNQGMQQGYGYPQPAIQTTGNVPVGRYNNRPTSTYNPNTQPGNYQQPAQVNLGRPIQQGYQQPTTTATTPTSVVNRVSARQVEQPVVSEPKQEVKPNPSKPINGSEYKPLTLPIYKVVKDILNDEYFKYEIIEKDNAMDLEKHKMVYGELTETELNIKEYKPEVITDKENIALIDTLSEAFNGIYTIGIANREKVLVKDLMLTRPVFVKKKTNNRIEELYINLVKHSNSIKEFASGYRDLIIKLTKDAVDVGTGNLINKILTKRINTLLELRYGNEITIDSFLDDIDDLIKFINDLSPAKQTNYKTCFIEFMDKLKQDVREFEELTSEEGNVNIEEFYKESIEASEEHKLMFIPETMLAIINFSDKLVYELSNANTEPKEIVKEQTPILFNTIESVFEEIRDTGKEIVLFTADRKFYKALKNKNGKFTIKKMGEG